MGNGASMCKYIMRIAAVDAHTVARHDNMAKIMGVAAKPFSHSTEGKIIELQCAFMVYVCNLADLTQPGMQPTQTTFVPRHDLQVTIDVSGYPVMPAAPPDSITQTKSELAGLLRTYLNKHYCGHPYFIYCV